ncbi:MAG: hypothetical protein ACK4NR_07600 [Micavibrio sp.]
MSRFGNNKSKSVLPLKALFGLIAFCIYPALTIGNAHAQQGNPEVFVDMSVLQGLGEQPEQSPKPVQLKPPSSMTNPVPSQPQLIRPAPTPSPLAAPVVTAPAPAVKPPAAINSQSQAVSRAIALPDDPKPVVKPPVAVVPQPQVQKSVTSQPTSVTPPVATKPVSPQIFPVETRTKSESANPATPSMSRPVPVRSGIAGNLNDSVLSRPAPDFDPEVSAPSTPAKPVRDVTEPSDIEVKSSLKAPPVKPSRKPAYNESVEVIKKEVAAANDSAPVVLEKTQAIQKSVPEEAAAVAAVNTPPAVPPIVPPRRPDIQQVSPDIIASLIEREQKKIIPEGQALDVADPPPPPGPRGKKNMPAVAKPSVDAEPLQEQIVKLPATNDPLLGNLIEKDKKDLVSEIEAMVDARESGEPLPSKKAVERELGTNIVKAEPMQRPYNVYRPQKESGEENLPPAAVITEAEETKEIKLASIPRPPQPRSEDEEAYVSVPFAQGLITVNEAVSAELESRLLPLLNDNPAWKLQIQSFASPLKDGLSSARKASLDRGLAVRNYLLGKGIEASRIDVRALGAESDRDPMDRVDLILFDPSKRS